MPLIDIHAHYGDPPYAAYRSTLEDLAAAMARYSVDHLFLASTFAQTCDFIRGNAELQKALEGREGMLGYVVVNAHYPEESAEEVRKYLGRSNFVGTYFHPAYSGQRVASEGTRRILDALRRYSKPVLFHTSHEQDVRDTVELAREYATLPMILGQTGGAAWETAIRATAEVLNCHLEIGAEQAERDKIREALAEVGPKRILFGSNMNVLHPAYVAGMVRDADIPNRDRDRIFYRNALELFGLS
jgi:predicted TIM-barrel fold metal-dependent hydrolase